jgi:hypothetical protein
MVVLLRAGTDHDNLMKRHLKNTETLGNIALRRVRDDQQWHRFNNGLSNGDSSQHGYSPLRSQLKYCCINGAGKRYCASDEKKIRLARRQADLGCLFCRAFVYRESLATYSSLHAKIVR